MGDLSEHFSRSELACPCGCGFGYHPEDISPRLVALLEDLRNAAGDNPVYICKRPGTDRLYAAGCRCPDRNRKAGGVRNSQHLRGCAADIVVPGMHPDEVADLAEALLPNGGVGRYNSFTHVDVRGHRARWDMRTKKESAE